MSKCLVIIGGGVIGLSTAYYFPLDCHLVPARFLAALESEIARRGGSFLWESEVVDWTVANGRRLRALRTARGDEIEADEFVLCGGAWSPLLARKLGLDVPIQAGQGYSLTLPQPRQLPQLCSILTEARVAVTPMAGALRVAGTMEFAGLEAGINPVRVRAIVSSFCRYFPDFRPEDFAGLPPWRGLRPCSPDGLPYVGRTAKFDNLSLATGHAMLGLSLGPATGKLMAQILSGEKPALNLALLSPDRYH